MRIYYIIHTMLAQRWTNMIKVISVTVGLFVSCIIFTFLAYIYSYNKCYRDNKHLYVVRTTMDMGGKIQGPSQLANSALAGAIMDELPDDVIATSYMDAISCNILVGEKKTEVDAILADSLFFETMGLDLLSGYPRKDLAAPGVIYLSSSLARELYGDEDPIGKNHNLEYNDGTGTMTVKGIYKDLPGNTTRGHYRAIISLPSMGMLGRKYVKQWDFIDGFMVYIRVLPESKVNDEVLDSKLMEVFNRNHPETDSFLKQSFSVMRMDKIAMSIDSIRRTSMVMWILGISILLITTFNYALITIASLSRRAKAIGVHKCSGASEMNIVTMFLSETILIISLSILGMLALLFILQPMIEEIMDIKVDELLSLSWMWASGVVLLFFFLVGGLIPGYLFSRIPVTQVFRRFTDKNSAWKKNLLFIQIAGVAFVSGILVSISSQYHEVMTHDMGFDFNNIISLYPNDRKVKNEVLEAAVRDLPYVQAFATGIGVPMIGSSEIAIYDDNNNHVGSCAFTSYSHDFMKMFKFRLLKGRYPTGDTEVLINEKYREEMNLGDSVIGRKINAGRLTVTGVLQDYYIRGFEEEVRPAMMQRSHQSYEHGWFVQLSEPFDDNYKKFKTFLNETFPGVDFAARSSKEVMERFYRDLSLARMSVGMALGALILIAIMGLFGFIRDEVERRRKEIAIHKVNGATAVDVIFMVCGDLLKLTVPAVVIGLVAAWYVAPMLMGDFTITPDHLLGYIILDGLAILALVLMSVCILSYRAANENPVNQLKSE